MKIGGLRLLFGVGLGISGQVSSLIHIMTEIRNHEDDNHRPLISLVEMIISIEDQEGTTYVLINQYPIQSREILNSRTEFIKSRS